MTKTFTENDAVKYVYNELKGSIKAEFEKALMYNAVMAEYVNELLIMKESINRAKKEPSDKVIDAIMEYSKSFSLHVVQH